MRPVLPLALAATLLAGGCLAPRPDRPAREYLVTADPTPDGGPATDWTLGWRRLESDPAYGLAMRRRRPSNRLVAIPGAEWASPPSEAVTDALATALGRSGAFADVGPASAMTAPDLLLTGRIRRFDATADRVVVVVDLAVRANDLGDAAARAGKAPLYRERLRAKAPREGDGPAGIAQAASAAVEKLAERAGEGIAKAARRAAKAADG